VPLEGDDVSANAFAGDCAKTLEDAIGVMRALLADESRKAKVPPELRSRCEASIETLRIVAEAFRITERGCAPTELAS
jgi:hypothetical protein